MRLLLIIMALLPLVVSAENYFRNGMQWEYELQADGPAEYPVSHTIYSLVGDTVVDGYASTGMYVEEIEYAVPPKFLAFIRTEGDKVFFKYDYPEEEWALLYDFGMKPGDETNVDCISSTPGTYRKHFSDWVACWNVVESNDYPGVESFVMANKYSTEDDDYTQGEWLDGIGSTFLLTYGAGFGLSGGGSKLVRASMDGETVCESRKAKLESVKIDCDETAVLSLDGRVIYRGVRKSDSLAGMVCESGIYIIKTGDTVRKTAIRK